MKVLILILFVFTLASCNKYDDTVQISHLQVPPYTETGANTFGCLVNGAPWANAGETFMRTPESLIYLGDGTLSPNLVKSSIQLQYGSTDTLFSVSGILTDSKNGKEIRQEYMSFEIAKVGNLKGTYKLTDSLSYFSYLNLITDQSYRSISRNPFTITIKKDTIEGDRHIVSGTFSGMLYNTLPDSVRITGGVFDVSVH